VSELTAHIQNLTPQLSRELRSEMRLAHKTRAAEASRYADFRQKPRMGSRGEDFPLVKRLLSLPGQ
jgi:hypothetical protein